MKSCVGSVRRKSNGRGRLYSPLTSLDGRSTSKAAINVAQDKIRIRYPAKDATFDISAQIVVNREGVRLQVCSPSPAPLPIRYPRSPISFLAGHEACTANCRTAGVRLGSPVKSSPGNRNLPLRTMLLNISNRFPTMALHRQPSIR